MIKKRLIKSIKTILLLSITACAFFSVSCASTKTEKKLFLTDENFTSRIGTAESDADASYIFLRFYDPELTSPFYVANILKNGISKIDVNPLPVSHVSIGFDLRDDFFGLTLMSHPQLDREHCTDTKTNNYTKQCDAASSKQVLYAIKATGKERKKAIRMLMENKNVRYDVDKNFKIANRALKRKLFTAENDRSLEKFYASKKDIEAINDAENKKAQKKFVCSTFVAYVLYNSVQSVRDFFNKNHIDYHYLMVSDIACIPGVEELFESTWEDYGTAARTFVAEHKEFQRYLPKEERLH
ncbi:hypothetical protein [Treponema socranskii]|uniref:hypothetical protein n=1 Tax=Treponema socranskii TaxID=53419 RepID=UPI003D8F80EA